MFLYIHPSTKVISDGAFCDNEELEGVELCEGLERIGQSAFSGCQFLRRIKIPSTVKVIEDEAFENCDRLEEVELCEGLEQIGEGAFSQCACLNRIKIPSTVKVIEERAFENCDRLEEVELCEGLEEIGIDAFSGCVSLKGIKIPSTVMLVGEEAFHCCNQLEEVELGENLTIIECGAFSNCKFLRYITIPPLVKVIGRRAFQNCQGLVEVELCEGLEVIEGQAFKKCISLKSIKIPSTIQVIGEETFSECQQLDEVNLNEGLGQIEDRAFYRCSSLKRIIVPSTVQAIYGEAFEDCNNLISVELNEGLQKIGFTAFCNCKSLRHIKIPSTVKVIGQRAFGSCQQLEVVELFEGLGQIEEGAFNKCGSLKCFKIPSTVKVIGEGLFSGCRQLISVELCDGIEQIDESAFQHCDSLRNIAIPITAQASKSVGRGCYDLQRLFGSQENIKGALTSRFDGLPIHKLCYYQSHNSIGTTGSQSEAVLKLESAPENERDSLGMTPLHILACSTRQKLDFYQCVVGIHPKSLIAEDKWGCLPILYAIWSNTSEEIIQYLVKIHKATFPSIDVNWNKMVETVCRAGASPDVAQRLIGIQQTFFLEHNIDWQNIGRELTISCLVRCEYDLRDFSSIWDNMIETTCTRHAHKELTQSLREIEQRFFPDKNDTNWRLVCEEFVRPIKGWWHPEDPVTSSITFHFLVKCSVQERLDGIGVAKWKPSIESMVKRVSHGGIRAFIGTINSDIVYLPALLDSIHSKTVFYEQTYRQLKDATSLLELALWKSKIDESMLKVQCNTIEHDVQPDKQAADLKAQCFVNCGADVIIPLVLQFVIGD